MPRVKLFDQEEALGKAMMLFWEQGYHNTSIQDLTEHLGISRGSLYDTFGDKKQLYDRALAHYCEKSLMMLRAFVQSQQDIKAGFRFLFQNILSDIQNDPDHKGCFVVNTTTELLPDDPSLLEAVHRHNHSMESIFQSLLQKGVAQGTISADKDIKSIARSLYVFLTGLRVLGKTQTKLEDSFASVEAVLAILD
ncbi:MAG: TetR/AcrR family transcriptional regulator [Bacteroidota bacterium]